MSKSMKYCQEIEQALIMQYPIDTAQQTRLRRMLRHLVNLAMQEREEELVEEGAWCVPEARLDLEELVKGLCSAHGVKLSTQQELALSYRLKRLAALASRSEEQPSAVAIQQTFFAYEHEELDNLLIWLRGLAGSKRWHPELGTVQVGKVLTYQFIHCGSGFVGYQVIAHVEVQTTVEEVGDE